MAQLPVVVVVPLLQGMVVLSLFAQTIRLTFLPAAAQGAISASVAVQSYTPFPWSTIPHSTVRFPPATIGLLIRYCCTALKSDVFGLVGGNKTSSETFAAGAAATDTMAVADLVESASLVAVTTTEVFAVTLGAVNKPLVEIVPCEAVQIAAVFEVLAMAALN